LTNPQTSQNEILKPRL